jgi:hypothetical protein
MRQRLWRRSSCWLSSTRGWLNVWRLPNVRKKHKFLTFINIWALPMSQITEAAIGATLSLPEGGLISPKAFLHLGSRAAVDQALTRLTSQGALLRVGCGSYVAPVLGRFGSRAPSTQAVIQSLEAMSGETIVASGAAEANNLGLTNQVPTREIFITSGRARKLQLGSRVVELRRGNRHELLLGKHPAGKVIRALIWLGPEQSPAALPNLRKQLSNDEWETLRGARVALPSWMAQLLGEADASRG